MQVIRYIQDKIANGQDPWEALRQELAIKIRFFPQLGAIGLNYDQLNSPDTHPVVRECRGLVISEPKNGIVQPYCRGMERFFNHGEQLHVTGNFQYNGAYGFEKRDGSLMLYWYHPELKKRIVASKNMAKAEGTLPGTELKYEDLFYQVSGLHEDVDLDPAYTFNFELTDPRIKSVKRYNDSSLTLISMVHTETGEEVEPDVLLQNCQELVRRGFKVDAPKFVVFESQQQMEQELLKLRGLDEGFVLVQYKDANGAVKPMRLKAKTAGFLAAMHLEGKEGVSKKRAAVLVVTGEYKEVLAYKPEFADLFAEYLEKLNKMTCLISQGYQELKDAGIVDEDKQADLKQAATLINGSAQYKKLSSVFFSSIRQGLNPVESWNEMNVEIKAKMLEAF